MLQALYTVRRERQLCARLQTDLLFRWFVDLPLDADVFNASTFSKNQARLLTHEVADLFFMKWSRWRRGTAGCPTITSVWTPPSSRRGPR